MVFYGTSELFFFEQGIVDFIPIEEQQQANLVKKMDKNGLGRGCPAEIMVGFFAGFFGSLNPV